jgi:hypothetical protein
MDTTIGEIKGSRVRLQGKSMLTHTELRAQEEANVRDYYQNLVRDLQRDLNESLGPIQDSGKSQGFTKEIEAFSKKLDDEVKKFGETKLTKDSKASDLADEIMKSKPLSVNAPESLKPHPSADAMAAGDKARQGTIQGGDGTPRSAAPAKEEPTSTKTKEEAKK